MTKKIIRSEKLAKLINKEHDEIIAMLCLIVMKHPTATKEFIIDDKNILITADGIELIVDFMLHIQRINLLIDLMEDMNREE